MTNSIMIFLCSASLFITLALTLLIITRARTYSLRGGQYFVFLLLAISFWTLLFIFEFTVDGAENKMLMSKLQCVGVVCIPIAFDLMCNRHFSEKPLKRLKIAAYFAFAAVYLSFVWTSPGNAYVTTVKVTELSGDLFNLTLTYGPAFYVLQAVIVGSILANAVRMTVKMFSNKVLWRQTALIVLSILAPLFTTFLHKLHIVSMDWTNASFVITAILLYICFVNYGIFDSITYVKRNVLEMLQDAIFVLGESGEADYANNAAKAMLRMGKDEYKGKRLEELFPGFVDENADVQRIVKGTVSLPQQEPMDLSVEIVPLSGPGEVSGSLVTVRNITLIEGIEKKLDYLQKHDEVTGLYNKNKLVEIMQQFETEAQYGLAGTFLCAGSIANISILSGMITQEEREAANTQISRHVAASLLPGSVLAKVGENEYYMFSNGATADFTDFTRLLMETRKVDITIGNRRFGLEFRMGVYILEEGVSIETALANAAFALSAALASPRQKVVFYERSIKVRHDLYKKMISSVGDPNYLESFELEYQPIIDVKNNRVAGAEALVRWNHPVLGKIYPDSFYTVFENLGNMNDLGLFILAKSFLALKRWREQLTSDFFLWINISKIQVEDKTFIEDLQGLVEDTGVDPSHLRFEISENAIGIGIKGLMEFSEKIQALGAKVVFGNIGQSSLLMSDIMALGADKIKLAPSIAENAHLSRQKQIIAGSILELCNQLEIELIVDCVENVSDLSMFIESGFSMISGHAYSRSLPDDAFIEYYNGFDQD